MGMQSLWRQSGHDAASLETSSQPSDDDASTAVVVGIVGGFHVPGIARKWGHITEDDVQSVCEIDKSFNLELCLVVTLVVVLSLLMISFTIFCTYRLLRKLGNLLQKRRE